jgi:hypothetical protein
MRSSPVVVEGVEFVMIRAADLKKFVLELSDLCDCRLVAGTPSAVADAPVAVPPAVVRRAKSLVAPGKPSKKRALPAAASVESARGPVGLQPLPAAVLAVVRAKGEADVAEVLDALEKQGTPIPGDDPVKAISNAFFTTLRVRGFVEHVEGRRGYWKVAS